MSEGWIKLHRKIKAHWIYENPDYFRAWVDLLLSVNHESVRTPYGDQIIDVAAGSIVTSVQKLTDGWGWSSKSQTKRFLDLLVNDGMVKLEQNGKYNKNGTVLSIENWDFYQGSENGYRTDNRTDIERIQNGSAPDTYLNNNKNGKKEKKEKKASDILPDENIFKDRTFSDEIKGIVNVWLKYKAERKEIYKPTGLTQLLTRVENALKEYSEAQVIFAISESMSCNYQGIVWDKVKRHSDVRTAYGHDSKAYKCARYLDKKIRKNIPSFPNTNEEELQIWAMRFDELNRIDNQEWEDISDVLDYCQEDTFWQSKIQNANAFKEKFFRLMGDMKSKNKQRQGGM